MSAPLLFLMANWGLWIHFFLRKLTFLLFLLEFVLSSEEFDLFLVFQHNGSLWLTTLHSFCRQSMWTIISLLTRRHKVHQNVWCSTRYTSCDTNCKSRFIFWAYFIMFSVSTIIHKNTPNSLWKKAQCRNLKNFSKKLATLEKTTLPVYLFISLCSNRMVYYTVNVSSWGDWLSRHSYIYIIHI